jgi:DNA-binding CsgD family transcriptional regulator
LLGRLGEAISTLQQSASRRPLRGSRRRAWGGALAARLYAEMGQLGRARRNLELTDGAYDGAPMLTWGCWPSWTEGFLAWQEGRHADARASLTTAAEQLRRSGATPYEALVLTDLVQVSVDDGATGQLSELTDRLTEITQAVDGRLMQTLNALGAAWYLLLGGDRDRAAAAAADAVRTSSEGGYELHRATALTILGRARESDRGAAVDALSEAARIQDACGAVWRRDRTLAVLRRWGARGQRAAAEVQGPGSLTGREREVAELAALGHTAREIGERLFISSRTVETHLANAYGKLGVASKRELVRRAEELGLRSGPAAPVP